MIGSKPGRDIQSEKLEQMSPKMRDLAEGILNDSVDITNPQFRRELHKLTDTFIKTSSVETREITGYRIIGGMKVNGLLSTDQFEEEIKAFQKINTSREGVVSHPERE